MKNTLHYLLDELNSRRVKSKRLFQEVERVILGSMLNEKVESGSDRSQRIEGKVGRRKRKEKKIGSVKISGYVEAKKSASSTSVGCKLDQNKMSSSSGGELIKFEGKSQSFMSQISPREPSFDEVSQGVTWRFE